MMNERLTHAEEAAPDARTWISILAPYREPSGLRSMVELIITLVPFIALWFLAWAALDISYWLSLGISVLAGGFLVRIFAIQHDCGHGTLFRRRQLNDWIGRLLGVLTLTPYDDWRRDHAIHHATSGNLEKRGVGDIETLTVREYLGLSIWRRCLYRAYRNPLVLFVIGPAYQFIIRHRWPLATLRAGRKTWVSTMLTNSAILMFVGAGMWMVGIVPFLIIHLPIILIAASIGVWLFYVQHQFEDTTWSGGSAWDLHHAALHGSSYYDLPAVLNWFTANIGVHHVHHLCSRIPYYRLQQVLRDYPVLAAQGRLTLYESLGCIRLALWDEHRGRLVSFKDALTAAA